MKQSILAVDDEPDLLRLTERIISTKTPYQITTTNNSLEVPKILEKKEFDLILVDLKMPGLDGMEILRMVRENNRFEQVIMVTAFGSLDTAVEAMSLGVFDYITKPFKKEQIIFTVDKAMRYQKAVRLAKKLSGILQAEPFDKAKNAFVKEYVAGLSIKYNGDVKNMAKASGLTEEAISRELESI